MVQTASVCSENVHCCAIAKSPAGLEYTKEAPSDPWTRVAGDHLLGSLQNRALQGTRKLSSPVPTKSIVGVKPGVGEPLFNSHVVRPSESTPATLALTG